jgi:hypothetical protein
MTLSVVVTEADDVTPFKSEAFGTPTVGSSVTKTFHLVVSGGDAPPGFLYILVKNPSAPTQFVPPDASLPNGRYFSARLTSGDDTSPRLLWGGGFLPTPAMPSGTVLPGEVKWEPVIGLGAGTENDDFQLRWRAAPAGVPLVDVLAYEGDAIVTGVGASTVTEWAVAPKLLASGTPDDLVHVDGDRVAVFAGVEKRASTDVLTADQNAADGALAGGQEYRFLVSQDPTMGAPTLTKGNKAASGAGVIPALPAGHLRIGWGTVAYNGGGSAIAQAALHTDAVSGRFLIEAGTGLTITVGPGRLRGAGGVIGVRQLGAVPDDTTSYVWITTAGEIVVTSTAAPNSVGDYLRGTVTTAGGAVTVVDNTPGDRFAGSGGGGGPMIVHPTPGATVNLDCSLAPGGGDIIFDWTPGEDETVNAINLTLGQRVTFRIHEDDTRRNLLFGVGIWTGGFTTQGSFDIDNLVTEVNFIAAEDGDLWLMPIVRLGVTGSFSDFSGVSGTITVPVGCGPTDQMMAWRIILNGDLTIDTSGFAFGKIVRFYVAANAANDYTVTFGAGLSRPPAFIPKNSGVHVFTFICLSTIFEIREEPVIVRPTPGATVVLDCSLLPAAGGTFEWKPGEDETVQATNLIAGQEVTVRLVGDGSDHTLTFDAATGFVNGITEAGVASINPAVTTFYNTDFCAELRFRAVSVSGTLNLLPVASDAASLWGKTWRDIDFIGGAAANGTSVVLGGASPLCRLVTSTAGAFSLDPFAAVELALSEDVAVSSTVSTVPGNTLRSWCDFVIKDDGTARAVTWDAAKFVGPAGFTSGTTAGKKRLYSFFVDYDIGKLILRPGYPVGPY